MEDREEGMMVVFGQLLSEKSGGKKEKKVEKILAKAGTRTLQSTE